MSPVFLPFVYLYSFWTANIWINFTPVICCGITYFKKPPLCLFVCLFYRSVSTLPSKWAVFGRVSERSTCRQSKVAYHILWYNLSECPLGWHFDGSTQSYLSEGDGAVMQWHHPRQRAHDFHAVGTSGRGGHCSLIHRTIANFQMPIRSQRKRSEQSSDCAAEQLSKLMRLHNVVTKSRVLPTSFPFCLLHCIHPSSTSAFSNPAQNAAFQETVLHWASIMRMFCLI